MTNIISNPEEFEDQEEYGMFHACPNCERLYDEIDFEYQRCHWCKFSAEDAKCKDE